MTLGRVLPVGPRLNLLCTGLVAANIAAWAWALVAFRNSPVLLGSAALAYGFGLRHAVDADHIAAIDNVTRRLMQVGKRPIGVGLWFSLGHSTVVVLGSVGLAATALAFRDRLLAFQALGNVLGTLVSALFLLIVAGLNLTVLMSIWQRMRPVKTGPWGSHGEESLPQAGGLLARFLRPVLALVGHSWHMFPLGLLFGLGFDTATEVGLLGISATQAQHGMPVWSILVFPALFTAGMALVDTADNLLMLGAYGWALDNPLRKLTYNMAITGLSVLVAVLVSSTEIWGLLGDRWHITGGAWTAAGALNGNLGLFGFAFMILCGCCWMASIAWHRVRT